MRLKREIPSPGSFELAPAPHICILGGGFGGLYCALALHHYRRRLPQGVRVTLVEPRDRFTFTPLVYELLTHELSPSEIAPAYADLLAHTTVTRCQDWVETIDLAQRQVILRRGEALTYDYLVVALGSGLRPPAVPSSHAHALPFNTLEDLWNLDRRLTALERQSSTAPIRIVIAGAGPSGIELACKLADRLGSRGQITLLERRAVILRSHPAPLQRAAAQALRKRGVEVYTHVPIDRVEANAVFFQRQGQPQQRQADMILWTVGTVPRPWPGLACPKQTPLGQCLVRPTLQLLGHDRVFVLGDMAAMPAAGRDRAPMTAQAAFQAAPVVAHNLWAKIAHRPLRPFTYKHLGDMLTLGQGEAVICGPLGGFTLCLTGRLGGFGRRWAYWLRLPTWGHRWRTLRYRLGRLKHP
ncbi:MAG: NAD(P)/FAD-dependent oxidoreductase [Nodosilinea sp.]